MKILFDHPSPFFLAHGGVQVQIEQTKLALERHGINTEFIRWWDQEQTGSIIHYFGPVSHVYLRLARQKGIPVVLTSFFSETCNRSDFRMKIQGLVTRGALALPGWTSVKTQLQWQTFREADQVIVGLEAERRVLEVVYGVPATRITILPLGLDPIYLSLAKREKPGSHLISVGTVCEVKRSVDLAELARSAQVPILFVGNPYSYSGPYWKHFQSLIDNRFVFHRPHITDLASMKEVVSEARGFVLYSIYENWSLAAHEAAACGLPLLLPDTKWARECFTNQAVYLSSKGKQAHALELREFYECADRLPVPKISNYSWSEVAKRLLLVYEGILQRAPSPP